jgi:hypothetical protein
MHALLLAIGALQASPVQLVLPFQVLQLLLRLPLNLRALVVQLRPLALHDGGPIFQSDQVGLVLAEQGRQSPNIAPQPVTNQTVFFDLQECFQTVNIRGQRNQFTIDHGDLAVSRRNRAADSRVRVDSELFDRIVSGQSYVLAAVLRSAMAVEGDLELLWLFQRMLPGRQVGRQVPVGGDGDDR